MTHQFRQPQCAGGLALQPMPACIEGMRTYRAFSKDPKAQGSIPPPAQHLPRGFPPGDHLLRQLHLHHQRCSKLLTATALPCGHGTAPCVVPVVHTCHRTMPGAPIHGTLCQLPVYVQQDARHPSTVFSFSPASAFPGCLCRESISLTQMTGSHAGDSHCQALAAHLRPLKLCTAAGKRSHDPGLNNSNLSGGQGRESEPPGHGGSSWSRLSLPAYSTLCLKSRVEFSV